MRIKGVPLEEAAPNVQVLYRKVAELVSCPNGSFNK
jgi:hypothetical protein